MSEPEPAEQRIPPPSIAELVFAGEPRAGSRRVALAAVAVALLYVVTFAIVSRLGQSAGPWSAEMAARVHDAIALERAVDLTPPPPPLPSNPTSTAPRAVSARVARAARVSRPASTAPAQAAQLAAATPAQADFTGLSFVVGSGATYAGGTTTARGTNRAPVDGPVGPNAAGPGVTARNRSRSVSLDEAAWSCPWPAEADAQQVNEQTVVLRVAVRPDGRAERVDVLSDPGFGFGSAARSCALATRFEPARDPSGQPIAANSPPIRVHFFR
jgi:protein TonB